MVLARVGAAGDRDPVGLVESRGPGVKQKLNRASATCPLAHADWVSGLASYPSVPLCPGLIGGLADRTRSKTSAAGAAEDTLPSCGPAAAFVGGPGWRRSTQRRKRLFTVAEGIAPNHSAQRREHLVGYVHRGEQPARPGGRSECGPRRLTRSRRIVEAGDGPAAQCRPPGPIHQSPERSPWNRREWNTPFGQRTERSLPHGDATINCRTFSVYANERGAPESEGVPEDCLAGIRTPRGASSAMRGAFGRMELAPGQRTPRVARAEWQVLAATDRRGRGTERKVVDPRSAGSGHRNTPWSLGNARNGFTKALHESDELLRRSVSEAGTDGANYDSFWPFRVGSLADGGRDRSGASGWADMITRLEPVDVSLMIAESDNRGCRSGYRKDECALPSLLSDGAFQSGSKGMRLYTRWRCNWARRPP